jgi:hypothetical protein
MDRQLEAELIKFRDENKITSKGALAVIIHVTRYAKESGLPLSAESLITAGSGQVLGLGKGAVQTVLADYGITKVLAAEGGRTSRGSLGNMRIYVEFLNDLQRKGLAVMSDIEEWWIKRVREYFSSKPFKLRFDVSKGLQSIIHDLLSQAKQRQQESSGTMYQGAMLQHLVGAKLMLALPTVKIEHHGSSVADEVSERSGDFVIDNTVIHITTSPGEAIIQKCQRNLEAGIRPLILTLGDGVAVAKVLARNAGLTDRIDIMDAEQFLTTNLYELSLFNVSSRSPTFGRLIDEYNRIVSEHESDPSLRIERS